MTGFTYEVEIKNQTVVELFLYGYMDEKTALPNANEFLHLEKIVVNFRQVEGVLSFGIKKWILFISQLEKMTSLKIEFKDCPKQVVDQINLVVGFLPKNGSVVSLFVPVYCNRCERSFNLLKKVDNIETKIEKVIEEMDIKDCEQFPICKEDYELEINTQSYLKFLDFNQTESK